MAQSPDVSRRHAEIRGDLALDGQIQLIAVRPLEILDETEEWATGCDELWWNEWKWINTGNAAACAGRTNYGWAKRRARGIFCYQLVVRTGKRCAHGHCSCS